MACLPCYGFSPTKRLHKRTWIPRKRWNGVRECLVNGTHFSNGLCRPSSRKSGRNRLRRISYQVSALFLVFLCSPLTGQSTAAPQPSTSQRRSRPHRQINDSSKDDAPFMYYVPSREPPSARSTSVGTSNICGTSRRYKAVVLNRKPTQSTAVSVARLLLAEKSVQCFSVS